MYAGSLLLVGLDLSWTATGLVRRSQFGDADELTIGTSPAKFPHRYERLEHMTREIVKATLHDPFVNDDHDPTQIIVGIEGYSFSSKNGREMAGGLGEHVRHALWSAGVGFYNIPPTTLKKATTGKGVAEKSVMMQQVYKRWGYEAKNDNTCDAFVLSLLAAQLHAKGSEHPLWSKVEYVKGAPLAKHSTHAKVGS